MCVCVLPQLSQFQEQAAEERANMHEAIRRAAKEVEEISKELRSEVDHKHDVTHREMMDLNDKLASLTGSLDVSNVFFLGSDFGASPAKFEQGLVFRGEHVMITFCGEAF